MQSNALERFVRTAPASAPSSRVLRHLSTIVRRQCCENLSEDLSETHTEIWKTLNQNTGRFGCTLISHRLYLDWVEYLLDSNLFCQFNYPFYG